VAVFAGTPKEVTVRSVYGTATSEVGRSRGESLKR
jgi:hypothetical protein